MSTSRVLVLVFKMGFSTLSIALSAIFIFSSFALENKEDGRMWRASVGGGDQEVDLCACGIIFSAMQGIFDYNQRDGEWLVI